MKNCSTCGVLKDESEFNINSKNIDGLNRYCKECQQTKREYYQNNKRELSIVYKQRYLENSESIKQRASDWYKENKEKVLEHGKKYREENKEIIRQRKIDAYNKEKAKKQEYLKWYKENFQGPQIPNNLKNCSKCYNIYSIEEFYVQNKETGARAAWCRQCYSQSYIEWTKNNPERYKSNVEKYEATLRKEQKKRFRQTETYKNWRDKYRSNPQVLIYDRVSQRIRGALKVVGAKKTARSSELVGCSWVELESHLKSTLPTNVTWEMFLDGTAHIDHSVPACSYDLTNPEEQLKCFHWSNLRILDGPDNCSKATQDKKLSIRSI